VTETKKLTDRIARLLETEQAAGDTASILASLEVINLRLDRLETAADPQSQISISRSNHPSLDKFAIAEAIADGIFGGATNEKACTFEPNGKPCDHCSMCSSLGF
jgi:hypothetical protein